jgi:hypothetical protein
MAIAPESALEAVAADLLQHKGAEVLIGASDACKSKWLI